jgi:hypothetical protein
MKGTVQEIIQSVIPKECIFDAHTIINYLKEYHSDIYSSYFEDGWEVAFYHSEISKTIATFEGDIIKRLGES